VTLPGVGQKAITNEQDNLVWRGIYGWSGGLQATEAQKIANKMKEARDDYYTHSSKLLSAVNAGTIKADDNTDDRWVALYDGWGGTRTRSLVQQIVLNKLKEIADKAKEDSQKPERDPCKGSSKVCGSTPGNPGAAPYNPSSLPKELGWDDVRGVLGGIAGLQDEVLKQKAWTEALDATISTADRELLRINKASFRIQEQIKFYENSPEIVDYLKSADAELSKSAAKVSLKVTAIKNLAKAGGVVGGAINVYEFVDTLGNSIDDFKKDKLTYMGSVQPVLEKIVAFNPVAGGLLFIKDETAKVLDLSRGIGDEYQGAVKTITDRYFQQYHVLAQRGLDGKDGQGYIDLYKKQREDIRGDLDKLYSSVTESLPFFGKEDTLARINEIRNSFLSEKNESKIIEKQNKLFQHFEAIGESKRDAQQILDDLKAGK